MKVSIKSFNVQMDIKNNGIEFEVYGHDGEFWGDCILTKSGLTWCQGKTSRQNGEKVSWTQFVRWMEAGAPQPKSDD
jgi:hypothetical protein